VTADLGFGHASYLLKPSQSWQPAPVRSTA
jgi:hypothetical protein